MNPLDRDKMRRAAFYAALADRAKRLAEYERRVSEEWSKIAGEPVRVEFVTGTFYGYCSELAALRLFLRYNRVTRQAGTAVAYSSNLSTWYFVLPTKP